MATVFDGLFDWVIDHLKLLCGALLVTVIAWQVYSGMYDWRAVTTSDLHRGWNIWVDHDVILSNVSIRNYEIREQGSDTILSLWLVNGLTNPPSSEKAVRAIGRLSQENVNRYKSLPWYLNNGTRRLVSVRLTVRNGFTVLRAYALPSEVSWFGTPYLLTVKIMNHLIPLAASVWIGIAVQVLVYGAIAILVWIGLVLVIPSFGD